MTDSALPRLSPAGSPGCGLHGRCRRRSCRGRPDPSLALLGFPGPRRRAAVMLLVDAERAVFLMPALNAASVRTQTDLLFYERSGTPRPDAALAALRRLRRRSGDDDARADETMRADFAPSLLDAPRRSPPVPRGARSVGSRARTRASTLRSRANALLGRRGDEGGRSPLCGRGITERAVGGRGRVVPLRRARRETVFASVFRGNGAFRITTAATPCSSRAWRCFRRHRRPAGSLSERYDAGRPLRPGARRFAEVAGVVEAAVRAAPPLPGRGCGRARSTPLRG